MLQLFLLKGMIIDFTFLYMGKDQVINKLRNADLTEEGGTRPTLKIYYHI